ncbi:MAG: co-chaperone GroES [Pseudomonadota bacterium]|nr:co-chaperone GroES [Pseudomonadota bacterium]
MKIRPLGDRLVVERIEQDTKTAGGIIIPDTAKEKPKQGKVIAVGSGKKDKDGKRLPIDVEVGDIVLFTQWAGNEVKIEGTEYLILQEENVLGIVESGHSKRKAA